MDLNALIQLFDLDGALDFEKVDLYESHAMSTSAEFICRAGRVVSVRPCGAQRVMTFSAPNQKPLHLEIVKP